LPRWAGMSIIVLSLLKFKSNNTIIQLNLMPGILRASTFTKLLRGDIKNIGLDLIPKEAKRNYCEN